MTTTTTTKQGQFKDHFEKGIEKLKVIAESQTSLEQREVFKKCLPYMAAMAEYFDTIPTGSNYEMAGYIFLADNLLNKDDQLAASKFAQAAIQMGR